MENSRDWSLNSSIRCLTKITQLKGITIFDVTYLDIHQVNRNVPSFHSRCFFFPKRKKFILSFLTRTGCCFFWLVCNVNLQKSHRRTSLLSETGIGGTSSLANFSREVFNLPVEIDFFLVDRSSSPFLGADLLTGKILVSSSKLAGSCTSSLIRDDLVNNQLCCHFTFYSGVLICEQT